MELLFWNMGKNDNAALALECMCSNGVSVAAFAEYSGTEFSDELLRGTEYRVLGFGGCDKIQVFVDRAVDVINCFEESRFTVFVLVCSVCVCRNASCRQDVIAGCSASAGGHTTNDGRGPWV